MTDLDIQQKLQFAKWALDASNPNVLLTKLMDLAGPAFTAELLADKNYKRRTTNNIRNWLKGTAPNDDLVFSAIGYALLSEWEGNAQWVRAATLQEFYDSLQPDYQIAIRKLCPAEMVKRHDLQLEPQPTKVVRASSGHSFRSALKKLYVAREHYDEIARAIDTSHFDQKLLYLDPSSAHNWKRLTQSATRRYSTYRDCCDTLDELVGSDPWKNLITSHQISTVVTLGGGAPAKDTIVIKSFEQTYRHAHQELFYVIVDTSNPMLSFTLHGIEAEGQPSFDDFLHIIAITGDFLNLHHLLRNLETQERIELRPEGKRILYQIPGNTIANINVDEFLRAILRAAAIGDLLLISIEFADTSDLEGYQKRLLSEYDNEDVKKLIIPAIRPRLDSTDFETSRKNELDVIKASPISGKEKSRVPPARAGVEVRAVWPGHDILLATSQRYAEDEFLTFMKERGFALWEPGAELLRRHSSNKLYKQVIFERLD